MKQRLFISFLMFGVTLSLYACNRDNGNSISPEEENQENNETMTLLSRSDWKSRNRPS